MSFAKHDLRVEPHPHETDRTRTVYHRSGGDLDRELFDALGDATFIHAEDGRCLAANRRACALFGGDEPSLIAAGAGMFSAAEEGFTSGLAQQHIDLARREGEATFEWRSRRADGTVFWSEVHLVTAHLDDQARVVARVRDIARVKETASRLDLAQRLYALVVRSLPGSVILMYDHDLRFVLADGPEIEATGFSKATLEGKTLFEALPEAFATMVEPYLRTALAGQTLALQVPYEDRWYSYNYVPVLDNAGAVVYGMVVGVNVTERFRAESALQREQADRERLIRELTDRNIEMEHFTYTVSHDLKSPLVTIRGFLGMLERDLALGKEAEAKADLARIGSAAQKMSTLLNDLLELSRVGRAGNVHAVVRLADVANVAVELLQGRIAQRGARVVVATDLPETVGDRTRLIQVLQNLVENAIKYAGDAPNPTVTIGTRPDPHAAILLVADEGIGVDPRYSERIFGPFEKLDPRAEGTGVGLALVRRIVEQHHGRVWVESDGHGKGSTFVVQLPRHAAGS